MAKTTPVAILGLPELEAAFAEISRAAARGVLKRAVAKAAKPIAQSMSDFAPIDSGALSESPVIEGDIQGGIAGKRAFAEVLEAGGTRAQAQAALRAANAATAGQYRVTADIGPNKRRAPHAHLVEFGTGPRFHKSGKYVGVMPPDPFVRPAWDRDGGATATERIKAELSAELDKAVARAKARALKG